MKINFHTLVLHTSSDLEVLFMAYVVKNFPDIRNALGVNEDFGLKFIPAGPLQDSDWTHENTLDPEELERRGYLFCDCGGGVLDQHGKMQVDPDVVSDIFQRVTGSDQEIAHFMGSRLLVSTRADGSTKLEVVACDDEVTLSNEFHLSIQEQFEELRAGRPLRELCIGATMASVDLMVHYAGLKGWRFYEPIFEPIVIIISENDLKGTEVAHDRGFKQGDWPHTARHLRNMIQGWNLVYKNNPYRVYELVSQCFDGIFAKLASMGVSDKRSVIEVLGSQAKVKGVFLHSFILEGFAGECGKHSADVANPHYDDESEEMQTARQFLEEVNASLEKLETEWEQGERDYANLTELRRVNVCYRKDGDVLSSTMVLAVGASESTRYGPVTRRAGGDRRNKAAITIQFYTGGKFVISTNGILLDGVAKHVRAADLRARGVVLSEDDYISLARTGHLTFTNEAGEEVQALYLTDYRKAFGNGFRANSKAEPSALTAAEIVEATLSGLREAI